MHRALVGLLAVAAAPAAGTLVREVRALLAGHNRAQAERHVAQFRSQSGITPEVAEATSWLGRGALLDKDYAGAERYAAETRQLALDLLRTRKLDDDRSLPLALGASIEVHAQTLAAQGRRDEAAAFLRAELDRWRATSLHERIQKNLNLLTLEGHPAPPLTASRWLGPRLPRAGLSGHPTLIFLWAHWCADCRATAPVIAAIARKYASRGLLVVAPTRLYGYVHGGEDADPARELPYIETVRRAEYPLDIPVPVSNGIFRAYGVSTTPTIVLTDRGGTVRLYHPGSMSEAELSARIEPWLTR